jgi:HEAT repeat protein
VLLKSKFPVSKACARVLSNLKDPSTVPVLIKAMRLEVEWMSSQAAVEALAEFALNFAQQICPALVEALGQGRSLPKVRSKDWCSTGLLQNRHY